MLYVDYLALSLVAVTAVLFVAARWALAGEARPESRAYAFAALAGGVVRWFDAWRDPDRALTREDGRVHLGS